jgi:hypothetical protein
MGAVYLTHPALADLFDDAVVAEGATDEVSHFFRGSRRYGIAVVWRVAVSAKAVTGWIPGAEDLGT